LGRHTESSGDFLRSWLAADHVDFVQLGEIEQAFKELKNDLSIRPIYHQLETRIEAHIFIAFLAYCLFVTLKLWLKTLAPGLTPVRSIVAPIARSPTVSPCAARYPKPEGHWRSEFCGYRQRHTGSESMLRFPIR
jgi:hypothetical protein